MAPEVLLYVMAGAVVVSAMALVLQVIILLGLYRTAQSTNAQIREMLPGLHRLIDSAQDTLAVSRKQITEVTTRANEVLTLTRAQLAKVDNSLGDVLVRLKAQLERAEIVMDDSLTKVHETVSTVHGGVMKPLREVSGVAAGIRAALKTLAQGGRPNVTQATHDEEMFI